MKFAIATSDYYLGLFDAFVAAGWTPVRLFAFKSDDEFCAWQATALYAEQLGIETQFTKITVNDLAELREQGCEALIIASYPWRVPEWRPYLSFAVNFHCSPLPLARGPYPIIRAITENWDSWAVTCHQVTQEFDQGDILDTESFKLQHDECHESLFFKVRMAANRLAARVACNLPRLWANAVPQKEGSYWGLPTPRERTLDFSRTTDQLLRLVRAFGKNGSFACIDNKLIRFQQAVGWVEEHDNCPGTVVDRFNQSVVVAASDGYIGIIDFKVVFDPLTSVRQTRKTGTEEG